MLMLNKKSHPWAYYSLVVVDEKISHSSYDCRKMINRFYDDSIVFQFGWKLKIKTLENRKFYNVVNAVVQYKTLSY